MNEAPVRVRVLKALLHPEALEVWFGPWEADLPVTKTARLAEGFCPESSEGGGDHPPEQRLLVAQNGWAYCPVGIADAILVAAWKLEGVEGPEEGSGG